ncbi:hypothetical protein AB0M34_27460 [Nocardia sp. NPDC050193]
MLVTLLVGAIGIAATIPIAVVWARDLPKTIAFAIAREPFGERSMLNVGNTTAGFDRIVPLVPDGDRIASVTITTEEASIRSTDRNGHYIVNSTGITGATDSHRFELVEPEIVGITADQLARIDLEVALDAAQERVHTLETTLVPPIEPIDWVVVRLEAASGDPHWTISFPSASASDVPHEESEIALDLNGRPIR